MRIVKDKPKSIVLTEEFWRNWRLEFIATHNEKIRKQKKLQQAVETNESQVANRKKYRAL